MNLQTVITNLRNTIAGKEKYLEEIREARNKLLEVEGAGAIAQDSALFATQEFLKININELNRILDDLVECEVKGIEHSWRENPDRSGGQFTDEEINRWCATGRM